MIMYNQQRHILVIFMHVRKNKLEAIYNVNAMLNITFYTITKYFLWQLNYPVLIHIFFLIYICVLKRFSRKYFFSEKLSTNSRNHFLKWNHNTGVLNYRGDLKIGLSFFNKCLTPKIITDCYQDDYFSWIFQTKKKKDFKTPLFTTISDFFSLWNIENVIQFLSYWIEPSLDFRCLRIKSDIY